MSDTAKTRKWSDLSLGQKYAVMLLLAGVIVLYSTVVAWNVTDILDNGINFWNVFWLALIGLLTLRRFPNIK